MVSQNATPLLNEEESAQRMPKVVAASYSSLNSMKISDSSKSGFQVSFSHVQLYVDRVQDIEDYKALEDSLNQFAERSSKRDPGQTAENLELWRSINRKNSICTDDTAGFTPQKRDVVKQLIAGFGFRVTGFRFPTEDNGNTRSLLVTSKDPSGVQILVTAVDRDVSNSDECHHFDAENLKRFFRHHSDRQGIAVLGFRVNDIETIYERYRRLHPNLIHEFREYANVKVLEVFAYYTSQTPTLKYKESDVGTVIRFVEASDAPTAPLCILPGLKQLDATFDDTSQAAYCDHWVSNVFSRAEFLSTLQDTLGFTPKVDFNAGVVAAGEAQIESTVTGNASQFVAANKREALRNQSQVYLPINNALSKVGHVHGFLEELGQGIQHVASRVENLVSFVQRCNEMRDITGEGFTFLNIPRSYYGVLTTDYLSESAVISVELAKLVMGLCEQKGVVSLDGAVDLDLMKEDIGDIIDQGLLSGATKLSYEPKREAIVDAILCSRYKNLYSLLRNHVSQDTYLGIVKNQILVDVQGDDILYQIFTCNILQREVGDEAPFFEFIQRVCSECQGEDGCLAKIKPGCGGFGIRNFLTLFLSIEVSKAMLEASEVKGGGDAWRRSYAQKQVDCFTSQLNDSNPILTEISDAMTQEGQCKQQMEAAEARGEVRAADSWKEKMEAASQRKQIGNTKLMECSARYESLMRSLREAAE